MKNSELIKKLREEYREIDERKTHLNSFLLENTDDISCMQRLDMQCQESGMNGYLQGLVMRINDLEGKYED